MCTLSWRWRSGGYQLAFNRDESNLRSLALLPRVVGGAIMPIDPDGGGTWIAVNRSGISFALLNAYEFDEVPPGAQALGRMSRGLLIPQLVGYAELPAIEVRLRRLVGPQFAAFRLCVIGRDGQVALWCWTGSQLQAEPALAPVVSAGANVSLVRQVRSALFSAFAGDLGQLHTTHWPEKGATSFCMHRDAAATVSLSVIDVGDDQIEFRYHPGSPCLHRDWTVTRLRPDAKADGQKGEME